MCLKTHRASSQSGSFYFYQPCAVGRFCCCWEDALLPTPGLCRHLHIAAEQLQEQSVSGEDIVGFANTNAEWGQFAKAIFGTTSALEGLCLRTAIKRVKDNAAAELTAGETTPATKKQKLGRCRADLIPFPPPQTDSLAH